MRRFLTLIISFIICCVTSICAITVTADTSLPLNTSNNIVERQQNDSEPIFVGLEDNYDIQAKGNFIKIPTAFVYDEIDIGLTYSVNANFDGQNVDIVNGFLTIEKLGVYTLLYSAINSRGIRIEKTVTLNVYDDIAPIVSSDYNFLSVFAGKQYKVPCVYVSDFYKTEQKIYLIDGNGEFLVDNYFTITENCLKLKYVVTEISDNALFTVYELPFFFVTERQVYGFDDYGTKDGITWGCYQSDLSSNDPTIYQIPIIEQNTDSSFVFDQDGKSFKITIEGKEGCNDNNSWPALVTHELKLGFIDRYETLSFMVYNAGSTAIPLNVQLNFVLTESFTADANCWTKITVDLSGVKTKYGSTTLESIKIFTDGFDSGNVVYYLDSLILE